MFCSHLLVTSPLRRWGVSILLVVSAFISEVRAHLRGVGHNQSRDRGLDRALSLSELAARLGVKPQAIYDLRSEGRGPKGFRIGAQLRFRDGRLRRVTGAARSESAAKASLRERLADRPGYGAGGLLDLTSSFGELAALWLADLELQKLSEGTKENYRDDLRLQVMPHFAHFALGEITTGRVEGFLRSEAAASYSRAMHTRTMLNLLFGFALRHDAIPRNPVQGTSPLRRPKGEPQALTLDQIRRIRDAAAVWRTGDDVKGLSRMARSVTSSRCSSERHGSGSAWRCVRVTSTTVPAG